MIFQINKNDAIEVRDSLGGGWRVVLVTGGRDIFLNGGFGTKLEAVTVAMAYRKRLQ